MGLYALKEISKESFFGIWENHELLPGLLSQMQLTPLQVTGLENIQSEKRKKEWVTVRLLLNEMLGGNDHEILYAPSGKPILNSDYSISISHSGIFTAILLTKNKKAGIDIQKLKPNIQAGIDFYLNKDEIDRVQIKNNNEMLHVYWSAKEALYKYCSDNEINFKNDLQIEPFVWNGSGELTGRVFKNDTVQNVKLHCEKLENYILAYSLS